MRRPLSNNNRPLAPTAPTRRALTWAEPDVASTADGQSAARSARAQRRPAATAGPARPSRPPRNRPSGSLHPLTDGSANETLHAYDAHVKDAFDRIVPVLKRIAALQHERDFIALAQQTALAELGFELPLPILESAWVTQLDMRTLFAWCVFETYEQPSSPFF